MKKNFKKIAAVALSCALTLGMTVNAFAANVDQFDSRKDTTSEPTVPTGTNLYKFSTTDDNTSTRNVTVEIAAPDTIYRVDVKWESTSFTFKFDGEWSPETHKYGEDGKGKFYAGTDLVNSKNYAEITVTNHSNAGVKAKFAYTDTKKNGFSAALYTTFTKDAQKPTDASSLASADLGDSLGNPEKAPNDVAYLVVEGAPESLSDTSTVTIGTITITINKN